MKEKIILKIIIVVTIICSLLTIVGAFRNAKNEELIVEKLEKGFYLLGEDNVVVEYGEEYKDEGFVASVEENKSVRNVKVTNNVDTKKIGEYEVTYTINYKNNVRSITRKVTVVDNIPPSIELECKNDVYVAVKDEYKPCKYKAFDNYDADNVKVTIDSNVNTKKKGDYKVTYTATDASNNQESKTITVHVRKKSELNYIKISIKKQRLYYYKNNELVFTTPVTTGRYNATKTGDFKVKNKIRNTTLKGKDYESKVQYWMGYSGNNFGIHDASWRSRFGTSDYYYVGSHGCVNVPTKNMKKLFNMVEVGTPVYIRNK